MQTVIQRSPDLVFQALNILVQDVEEWTLLQQGLARYFEEEYLMWQYLRHVDEESQEIVFKRLSKLIKVMRSLSGDLKFIASVGSDIMGKIDHILSLDITN